MQLVVPRAVAMAVRMLMATWTMNCHVSRFMVHTSFLYPLSIRRLRRY